MAYYPGPGGFLFSSFYYSKKGQDHKMNMKTSGAKEKAKLQCKTSNLPPVTNQSKI